MHLDSRFDEDAGRVGVEFPLPHGLLALRPKNLILLPALAIMDGTEPPNKDEPNESDEV